MKQLLKVFLLCLWSLAVSQMEELLASIAQKPVKEQKEILKQTFHSWKGDTEQTDDVTIAGIRV